MNTPTKILPLIMLAALSALAHADTGSESDMNGNGTGPSSMGRAGRRGGGKKINPMPAGKGAGTIRGECETLASPSNPLAGSCTDLELVLSDEKGVEVMKTRTSKNGHFEFAGEAGKNYRITSGSKYYEAVSPEGFVHGGDAVSLQLKQK
jgi:hypothetical protein